MTAVPTFSVDDELEKALHQFDKDFFGSAVEVAASAQAGEGSVDEQISCCSGDDDDDIGGDSDTVGKSGC